MPSSSVLYRSLHESPLLATSASGQFVTSESGHRVLDAIGGAAVSCIGHGDPRVIAAITKQLQTVDWVNSAFYTTSAAENLATLILRDQSTLTRALFVGSGSEAMESTLKLCRQYFVEKEGKNTPRCHFIARRQSYHGTTLGALGVGGHTFRRAPFEPLLNDQYFHKVSTCYAYRNQIGTEEEYTDMLIKELVDMIESIGPERVAAFIFEPVVGAALACVPATKDYIRRVREVCNQYGILMVADEVMCGMGRCTDGASLHAWKSLNPDCAEESVAPDIQTVGKGLGGGFLPIAAVLVSKKVVDVLAAGSGAFVNGFTYQSHPTSCAAALAVQTIVKDDNLLPRAAEMGAELQTQLMKLIAPLPYVGDVRGAGMFWGVEFVQEKANRRPFSMTGFAKAVADKTVEMGVQVYVCEGVADGVVGDAVIIAPAYTSRREDIVKIVDVLRCAILALCI